MATSHRSRSIVGVAIVASVALIGMVALRATPLVSGSSSWGPGRPAHADRTKAIWGTRPFSIGFELINDGSVPLRVTAISMPPATGHDLLTWSAPLLDPQDRGSNRLERLSPFAPFTLSGGDAVWVVLRGTFGNCTAFPAPPAGVTTSQSWSTADVGFRWAGVVPRHQAIPLPTVVEVARPADCQAA
jgi:hypothetical protein